MAWHSPLDLQYWFLNVLAGSEMIFLIISFIVIALLSAMFRFSINVFASIFVVFVMLFSVYTGNFYYLIMIIFALVIGWIISRLFK